MPKIIFVNKDGSEKVIEARNGQTVLELAHQDDLPLEGACEGSLACSTCHVIVDPEFYNKLNSASEEEEDMLDLAFGLTQTSRLGCQIVMSDKLDGLRVTIPSASRNISVK
jgi:2Fe-2S ferredoxin